MLGVAASLEEGWLLGYREPSPSVGETSIAFSTLHEQTVQIFHICRMSLCVRKYVKWWEKCLRSNMKVIDSAQALVDTLLEADDKLAIADFFFLGCGGCRALSPKICQFAEMDSNVLFLQINHEQHKFMCYSLNVHVLQFFRFYRRAQGHLCSFSCSNATIKKFKHALAMHSTDRCSLGRAKGLELSELMALAANRDLSFNYTPKILLPVPNLHGAAEKTPPNPILPPPAHKSMVLSGYRGEEPGRRNGSHYTNLLF